MGVVAVLLRTTRVVKVNVVPAQEGSGASLDGPE